MRRMKMQKKIIRLEQNRENKTDCYFKLPEYNDRLKVI